MSDEQDEQIRELDAQLKRISADVDHMLAKLDGIDALLTEALALVEGKDVPPTPLDVGSTVGRCPVMVKAGLRSYRCKLRARHGGEHSIERGVS